MCNKSFRSPKQRQVHQPAKQTFNTLVLSHDKNLAKVMEKIHNGEPIEDIDPSIFSDDVWISILRKCETSCPGFKSNRERERVIVWDSSIWLYVNLYAMMTFRDIEALIGSMKNKRIAAEVLLRMLSNVPQEFSELTSHRQKALQTIRCLFGNDTYMLRLLSEIDPKFGNPWLYNAVRPN